MTVPTVLTEASSGAPNLTGEPGSFRAVMKWAMPQLGWTEEFDDAVNNVVVFRNSTTNGSGKYLRVDDGVPFTSNERWARMNMYDTMSDINTGTGKAPPDALDTTTNRSNAVWKHYTDNDTDPTTPFYIIGTDRFVHIITQTARTYSAGLFRPWAPVFFGELEARDAGDTATIIQQNVSSNSSSWSGIKFSLSMYWADFQDDYGPFLTTSKDGIRPGITSALVAMSSNVYTYNAIDNLEGGLANHGTAASFLTGKYEVVKPLVVEDPLDMNEWNAGPRHRGRVPGMYLPIGNWLSEYPLVDSNAPDTYNGQLDIPNFPFPGGNRTAKLFQCSGAITGTSYYYYVLYDIEGDWPDE